MVIRQALAQARRMLRDAGIASWQLDAAVLLCHVIGCDRAYLIVHDTEQLTAGQLMSYRRLVARRADAEPVAYLTGHREFMSLDFLVGPEVLIPRPDTETLVEWALYRAKEENVAYAADLFCGSGCVGISLLHALPDLQLDFYDVSEQALAVAKKNAERLGVAQRCRFYQMDLMHAWPSGRYALITANPPYIETAALGQLDRDVRAYEPHLALDGGADGLAFYRRLACCLPQCMAPGAAVGVEVGEHQAESVAALFGCALENVRTVHDLAGIARVVTAVRKEEDDDADYCSDE